MAIRGTSFGETEDVISDADTSRSEEDGATVFVLQNIPYGILSAINDMSQIIETEQFSTKQTYKTQHSQKHTRAFKYGVKEIRNLRDAKDRPVQVEYDKEYVGGEMMIVLSDKTMNHIPLSVMNEIGQKIIKRQSLTEEQAKNSEALLSLFAGSDTGSAENADQKGDSSAATTSSTPQSETRQPESENLPETNGGMIPS